jgi:4-amino-4-deoxy-L-arabinose transferase-like glycosyltransferase
MSTANATFLSVESKAMSRPITFIFLSALIAYGALAILVPRVEFASAGEIPRIAASIATGHGFSNPFRQPTGPSAWIPPVYPLLLAGIFRVFGLFTAASYWAAVSVNVIVHGFSCVVLYWITREAFGRRTGWYAAMGLASIPLLFQPLVLLHVLGGAGGQGLFIPPNSIWNTHLLELTILLLIWLTLRKQTHWAAYGAAWGVAALIDPVVLALVPAFWAWRLYHGERRRYLVLAASVAALCVAPWLVRNYMVFHRPVFIRDNFGVELKVGNQPGNKGLWSGELHPDRSAYELSRVAKMGEVEYSRASGREAIQSILSHKEEFIRDSILRIGYFWVGTPMSSRRLHALKFLKYSPSFVFSVLAFWGAIRAVRSGKREALLFVAVLFFYPLVHYITHTFYGFMYQYPIQPEMLVLAISVVTLKKPPTEAPLSATTASV